MYFYNFGDFHVVGASPEILVRQEYTKRAPRSPFVPWPAHVRAAQRTETDKAAELELINDPKERRRARDVD
jgi:anthranilate synthase component 1